MAPFFLLTPNLGGLGTDIGISSILVSGFNCGWVAGETVDKNGVKIIGPVNVPSTVPYHASQMYAKNISNLLLLMVKDEELNIDLEDEILKDSLVTDGGSVVNDRVKESLGL